MYFDEAIDAIPSFFGVSLSIDQTACGVQAVFSQIYTNTDAGAELIDLIQNISQAIRIIKQVHNMYNFVQTVLLKGSIAHIHNFIAINAIMSVYRVYQVNIHHVYFV